MRNSMRGLVVTRAFAVTAMLLLTIASIPFGGQNRLQEAEATATLQYPVGLVNSLDLDGMIFYITEGVPVDIPIKHIGELTASELPPGLEIAPSLIPGLGTSHIMGTPDETILPDAGLTSDDPNNPPSAPFGVTLTSAESVTSTSVTAEIMIIVRSSSHGQPAPAIQLDKQMYTQDQTVRAKIEDPDSMCNFITNEIAAGSVFLTHIRERAGGPVTPIVATERSVSLAGDGSGDIEVIIPLGTSDLQQRIQNDGVGGNIDFEMSYSRSDCLGSTSDGASTTARIPVRSAGILFDRSQYAFGDTATVEIIGSPLTGSFAANVYDSNGGEVLPAPTVTPIPGNKYEINLSGVTNGYVVSATYDYEVEDTTVGPADPARLRSYTVVAEAKLFQRGLTIDRPLSLHSDEGLMLNLTDPAMNTDPNTLQTLDLVYSSVASGTTIASGSITGFVREMGPDSAIFANDVFLYFIRDGDPEPPGEFIKIHRTETTAVSMTVGTSSLTVTVEPFEERGDPQGIGSSGVSLPAPDPYGGLETVVLLTCASFGGDSDNDGLCTNWEYPATGGPLKIPYDGVTYTIANSCSAPAAAGCPDSRHKDIYLEVDYYSTQVSASAITTALESIRTVFNTAPISNAYGGNGIKFHYYVNENSAFSTVDVWGTAGNTGNDYDIIKDNKFGTSTERGGADPSDATRARFQAFHYAIFSEYQSPDSAASGNAELVGNDIIVSLRPFDSIDLIDVVDQIRGTLMHELGHNLGLYHGGPSSVTGYNVNCKTNYPSVMTYIRQLTTAYGTQKYSDSVNEPNPLNSAAPYESSPSTSVLNIGPDSSASTLTIVWSLDGGATLPTATIAPSPATIDWNQNGNTNQNPDSFAPPDILDLGFEGCTAATNAHSNNIYGADDWDAIALNLNFREINPTAAGSGFAAGYLPPAEFNSTHYMALKVAGVKSANYLIQNIPYVDFRPPYNTPAAAAEIKEQIACRLEKELPTCGDNYVPNNVSTKSVIELISENNIELAVKKLGEVRTVMDDEFGGDQNNDLFSSTTSYTPKDPPAEPIVLPMLDNNIASLKVAELNIPFAEAFNNPGVEQSFKVVTYDGVCEELAANDTVSYDEECIITLTGETVANATDTFAFDRNNLQLDLIGEGPLILEIHQTVAKKVNDVVSTETGSSIPFTQDFDDDTGVLTLNFTAPWYPRHTIIEHDKSQVDASLSTDHCGGQYHALFPRAGQTSELFVTATSNNPVNTTSMIKLEIRDGDDEPVHLDLAELSLGPKANGCVTMHWDSPSVQSKTYDAIIYVFEEDAGEFVEVSSSKIFIYPDP